MISKDMARDVRGEDTAITPMGTQTASAATKGWCPFADRQASNNMWSGRNGQLVKAVVLHVAQGNYEGAISWLRSAKSVASAHFVVAKDGRIAQLVSIDDSAWGNGLWYDRRKKIWLTPNDSRHRLPANPTWPGLVAGINPNYYTISIEHEGYDQEDWTPAMYDANLKLLGWIGDECTLTYVLHDSLIGHCEIDSTTRGYCPGPKVEWNRILKDIEALS